MFRSQGAKIAAVSIAILLFVLLLFVPRTPSVNTDDQEDSMEQRSVDEEVQEALNIMESSAPMPGILKLKEILEKDPLNIDAAWYLGVASMRTGQFEKAIERFEHVLKHDSEEKYFEARASLASAYEQDGQVDKAIENYKRFLESGSAPQLQQDVAERIAELEKKR